MKKTLLTLLLIPFLGTAQNQYSFGFSGSTADMIAAGWLQTNQSTSANANALWSIPEYEEVVVNTTAVPPVYANAFGDVAYTNGQTSPIPNGQAGGGNSFALVNFQSTSSTSTNATISNWLLTPVITVQNGDVVSFWSRKGTSGTTDYPDRLELRMSTAATHVTPTGGITGLGSFTNVALTINPTLAAGFLYPKVWTQYSYTVSGLSGPTAVKFGFRYYVTSGGQNGSNSDIIGIDTFSVDRTLKTSDFFKNNFTVYPNPVSDVVNISNLNNLEITAATVTDINGRVVKEVNSSIESINLGDLNSGVYFLRIKTLEGEGVTKLLKK